MRAMPSQPTDAIEHAPPWVGNGTDHYENFPVGSWLLPAALRPAVAAIYRFARYADDVADEGSAAPAQRLAELERLRRALSPGAESAHPIVEQLLPHLAQHALDRQSLLDLLSAFAQDVQVKRYASQGQLMDYCRRSANPVGRLMLQLFGCARPETLAHSDAICSALQLINFAQDVRVDWAKDRVYLPLDALAAAGLDDRSVGSAVAQGRADARLRGVIAQFAAGARRLLDSGRPLVGQVPLRLGLELRVIIAGGRRILDLLERNGHDPIEARPALRTRDLLPILAGALR